MNIFLVGMTGSGKSTLGKKLAEELQMNFIDSDTWIEKNANKRISDIFNEDGEIHFRKLETEFIRFAGSLANTVVATGAGLPCNNNLMDELNRMGITIWLDVDESILPERLKNDPTPRPKLAGFSTIHEAVASMFNERKKFYEKAVLQIKNPTAETLIQTVRNIL